MRYPGLASAIAMQIGNLKTHGHPVDAEHWQGIPTGGKPDLMTKELINVSFTAPMCRTVEQAQDYIKPNLSWAEDHFQERVSRIPSNPGEEYKNWPYWRGQTDETQEQGRFTHTYQERFWPKVAGEYGRDWVGHEGIRYKYGDLDDVVHLLRKYPHTRQATFPIFFPEDTGAVHGGRIPCTLHYHFLLRNNLLHLWYPIRSCDAVRHFRDDIYMANRLAQWVLSELQDWESWPNVALGDLNFTAYSFHAHMGDLHLL